MQPLETELSALERLELIEHAYTLLLILLVAAFVTILLIWLLTAFRRGHRAREGANRARLHSDQSLDAWEESGRRLEVDDQKPPKPDVE